jgi:ribosomal protein S18 acetylase RimI-like enzyme
MAPEQLVSRPFEAAAIEELAAAIAAITGGALGEATARTVLRGVIAGPEAVLDLWRGGERVGVAVSIDTCETQGDAAELNLFCPGAEPPVLDALLDWGEERAREVGRAHVDIPERPGTALAPGWLERRGYRVGYVMFDMHRPVAAGVPREPATPLPPGWRWTEADTARTAAFHETVRLAFAELPGAFVDDLSSFAARFSSLEPKPALLLSEEGEVAGFLRVSRRPDGDGVLESLGRHPGFRGLGLGEHLVARGLGWLADLGARDAWLEVAADNHLGLALYHSFGFRVSREMNVYRRRI